MTMPTTILTNAKLLKAMQTTVKATIRRTAQKWAPPLKMPIAEWARKYRYLSSIEAGRDGKYDLDVTPYLAWPDGPLDAIDNPGVTEIVCQKSAQVAWTSGVIGNAIGKWIDLDPSPILLLFPKEGAAKDYMLEKFEPMVEATPRLRDKIDLRSRRLQQTQLRKRFPGGFLKLVGSNSPSSVKSTPTPRVVVEEPDDCNLNLRGQGDSIKLAKERTKTYARAKVIIGGTPTVVGLSAIAAEMELSDKRVGMIPCHACGDEHALSFDNFRCLEDDTLSHPVYGPKRPETAYYACPHCGAVWDDLTKQRNVRKGRWQATAAFHGIAGFYLNELYSPFPGSRMAELMKKWLTAQHEFERGDSGPLIAFVNSSMGLPYEYTGQGPDVDTLAERALDYPAGIVPAGGLALTIGVDVQHTWLEIIIRAWGRGEESWLVLHERIYGNPKVIEDECWGELDKFLLGRYRSERGYSLPVTAMTIDSSDGSTSDAVYKYIRSRQGKGVTHVMAGKGHSNPDADIFTKPGASRDTNQRNTKATKYGVRVFMVGVGRAKDMLIGENGRVGMTGTGPGRFHCYKDGLAADYYTQLLAEVKAPIRSGNGSVVKRWQKKVGQRNEVLDCECYALHAARAAKLHLKQERQWAELEASLAQGSLFEEPPGTEVIVVQPQTPAPAGVVVSAPAHVPASSSTLLFTPIETASMLED